MQPDSIGILPANMRYRLVGNEHPQTVPNVDPVPRAGQLHLRTVSKASVTKPLVLGAGQGYLREWNN